VATTGAVAARAGTRTAPFASTARATAGPSSSRTVSPPAPLPAT
jgi:hypothetical protein